MPAFCFKADWLSYSYVHVRHLCNFSVIFMAYILLKSWYPIQKTKRNKWHRCQTIRQSSTNRIKHSFISLLNFLC